MNMTLRARSRSYKHKEMHKYFFSVFVGLGGGVGGTQNFVYTPFYYVLQLYIAKPLLGSELKAWKPGAT